VRPSRPERSWCHDGRCLPALCHHYVQFKQAHASAAIVNFSESAEQEVMPPYLDTLISKLMVRRNAAGADGEGHNELGAIWAGLQHGHTSVG
jgi:hypothetical protein